MDDEAMIGRDPESVFTRLLERIKLGESVGFGLVEQRANGELGFYMHCTEPFSMMGGLMYLANKISDEVADRDDDDFPEEFEMVTH